MSSPPLPTTTHDDADDTPLPPYLARHARLGFNSDDVAALIDCIDSSQKSQTSASHLPAELLLLVLEHVPIDHVLDWRLICRGFRDAIDGQILYQYLQRTELIGYMGPRHFRPMKRLEDEQYDSIRLLRARFQHIENPSGDTADTQRVGPIWSGTHAVFQIEHDWFRAFRHIGGAAARNGDTIEDADHQWDNTLDGLELRRADDGFGKLRWCIRLDHAVLDMDFPLEPGRNTFDVDVHLRKRCVTVAWKGMIFSFLKTEAALRRMLAQKQDSGFTFSHFEDCLRAIRRQRLQSALDPDNRIDRHLKWSLRVLSPLFGKPRHDHQNMLEDVENDATNTLLLLRREAGMSTRSIAYLRQLAADYEAMVKEVNELDEAFGEFKSHLTMSGFQLSISLPALNPCQVPRDPIAWPDDLRAKVQELLGKWKSQKKVIGQMKALLSASNLALALPEDSFDDLDTDF